MRHWNGQNPHRISRQPEDHNNPFADADDAPCTSMDGVKRNVRQNCNDFSRTFSSIGDPTVVHLGRSGKRHGRRLANDTTTSFADDDCRHYNLWVTGQLIQQSNCCTLLLAISSIGYPLGVHLDRPASTAFCRFVLCQYHNNEWC